MKTLTKLSIVFLLFLSFACEYSVQKEFYISSAGNEVSEAVKKTGQEISSTYKNMADSLNNSLTSINEGSSSYNEQFEVMNKNLFFIYFISYIVIFYCNLNYFSEIFHRKTQQHNMLIYVFDKLTHNFIRLNILLKKEGRCFITSKK